MSITPVNRLTPFMREVAEEVEQGSNLLPELSAIVAEYCGSDPDSDTWCEASKLLNRLEPFRDASIAIVQQGPSHPLFKRVASMFYCHWYRDQAQQLANTK